MSTYQVLDGAAALKYVYGYGSGTSGDPYILVHKNLLNSLIEEGKVFSYSTRISLANSAVSNYLIKTSTTLKTTLYELDLTSDNSPIFFDLYESAIVSANGTLAATINNNRTSSTNATSSIYTAPTVTSNGTLLLNNLTTGGKASGGQNTNEFGIVLKQNTNYLLVLTQSSGNPTANISPLLRWSET